MPELNKHAGGSSTLVSCEVLQYDNIVSCCFRILVNMDDRMIELFVDEDDFLINLDFDNQLGHFELTLRY